MGCGSKSDVLLSTFFFWVHKLTKEAPEQNPWVLQAQLSTSSTVRRRNFLGSLPISEIRSELQAGDPCCERLATGHSVADPLGSGI